MFTLTRSTSRTSTARAHSQCMCRPLSSRDMACCAVPIRFVGMSIRVLWISRSAVNSPLATRHQCESSSFYLAADTRCALATQPRRLHCGNARAQGAVLHQPHQQFSGHWNIYSPPANGSAYYSIFMYVICSTPCVYCHCGEGWLVCRFTTCFCADLRCVPLTLQPSMRTKSSSSSL